MSRKCVLLFTVSCSEWSKRQRHLTDIHLTSPNGTGTKCDISANYLWWYYFIGQKFKHCNVKFKKIYYVLVTRVIETNSEKKEYWIFWYMRGFLPWIWSYKSQFVKSGSNHEHKFTYLHCLMLNNSLKKLETLCFGDRIRPHPQHKKYSLDLLRWAK